MSESEIQALCEQYINRPFDEDDQYALRLFLRDLLKQNVKKPVSSVASSTPVVKKETVIVTEEGAPVAFVSKQAPILNKVEGYVRAVSSTAVERTVAVDVGTAQSVAERSGVFTSPSTASTMSPRVDVEERVKEARAGPGVKDRLGNWSQVLETADKPITAPPETVEERLAEAKGATGVKDRLGNWAKVVSDQDNTVTSTADPSLIEDRLGEEFAKASIGVKDRLKTGWTATSPDSGFTADPNLVQERLAEAKGASGVKDRLGTWTGTSEAPVASSDPNLIQERLAEAKGASGVKDRVGNWTGANDMSAPGSDPEKIQERLAEAKGASGVKDRLDSFVKVAGAADKTMTAPASTVEERLADVKGAVGIKDRVNVLKEVAAETEKVVTADPEKIKERLQGLDRTTSINDRTAQWSAASNDTATGSERKQPIELPTEEVTREQRR